MNPAIVWFRDDLRLADNPALRAAADTHRPLVCLYLHDESLHDERGRGQRSLGAAARWWLHGSLQALHAALTKHGGRLTILSGGAVDTLPALAAAIGAEAVYWNRRYDKAGQAIDSSVEGALKKRDINVASYNGRLLNEPWELRNTAGKPFRVFTAYWRAVLKQGAPDTPLSAPRKLRFHTLPRHFKLRTVALASLNLEPRAPDWAGGLREHWQRDEASAHRRLRRFLKTRLRDYPTDRDRPDRQGTSRLSPYLCFGNISVRQIWHAAHAAVHSRRSPANPQQLAKFLAELGWREFNYHVLYHHPDLAERNFQSRFDPLRWRTDARALRAWQRGLTGYPLVDAGMRELWATGWMHNRVRMVVASFLIKHLLHRLAQRRALVLGHAGGCRPGQQPRGLAVGGRMRRRRRALLSNLQPDACRGRSSIPTATTCAAGFPSSRTCRQTSFTSRGPPGPRSSKPPACGSARPIHARSWIITKPASGRS